VIGKQRPVGEKRVVDVSLGAWDLRHLLLSLEDRPRDRPDRDDLEGVVARAVTALEAVPLRPTIDVPRPATAPALIEGVPLWLFETNAWVLAPAGAGGDCVIVDVPPAPARLVARLRRLRLRPVGIVLTHAHSDHTGGVAAFLDQVGGPLPVYVHPDDRESILHPELEGVLARCCADVRPAPAAALVDFAGGDEVSIGGLTLRARHAPGHTAGSTCLLVEGAASPLLFTGDTLVAGGTGRCDLPGGSRSLADASLRALLETLPADTVVLPGHGGVTTVGAEGDVSDPTLAA
jgi:glyoxylase-like metal-dependent hydrolase (beta-lactamase superfamily II)